MPRSLQISVGPQCVGSGTCRRIAPDVFGADAQQRAVVLVSPVREDDTVWEALESCPVEALAARDAGTGEAVFP